MAGMQSPFLCNNPTVILHQYTLPLNKWMLFLATILGRRQPGLMSRLALNVTYIFEYHTVTHSSINLSHILLLSFVTPSPISYLLARPCSWVWQVGCGTWMLWSRTDACISPCSPVAGAPPAVDDGIPRADWCPRSPRRSRPTPCACQSGTERWWDRLMVNEWMNVGEWVREWVSGWMNGWIDGWMWVSGLVDGWMDGWMDGWIDGWMWASGLVDGWMK